MSVGFAANWDVFQSTPPVKAATPNGLRYAVLLTISIHAAREGGDDTQDETNLASAKISIHAAREGGDSIFVSFLPSVSISIHAAREGGDTMFISLSRAVFRFQSTPPVKAATV